MRNLRQFKPIVNDSRLEERLVMSTAPTALVASVHKPVVTSAQVTRTLNAIHSDLLSFQQSATNAILYAEFQVTSGHLTQSEAANLLYSYVGNKASLLFYEVRGASAMLPYGGGFNGYLNSTTTAVTETPSGADSLYTQLSFPSNGTDGPIGLLWTNTSNAILAGDFAGAVTDVNTAAIHSTYASVKTVVNSYVASEVKAGDIVLKN